MVAVAGPSKEPLKRKYIETGAPSQKSQSSRKGKRAWRKNVDITEIEAGLEGLREEEIVTGGKLQDRTDKELFEVDVVGDEQVRKRLQKEKKPLRFLQVLQSRSAVPAVHSRPSLSKPSSTKKAVVTSKEKTRLLQKAKRLQKGALNSVLDPTETGTAGANFQSRTSDHYDAWNPDAAPSDEEEIRRKVPLTRDVEDYVVPIVKKAKVKAPASLHPSRSIQKAAVEIPHPGTSYNPSLEDHQELLRQAHNIEVEREAQEEKHRAAKETFEAMKRLNEADLNAEDLDPSKRFKGMQIDVPDEAVRDEDGVDEHAVVIEVPVKKPSVRKTRQQKAKEARSLAERRLLAERAKRKKLAASITNMKSLVKTTNRTLSSREALSAARQQTEDERKHKGVVGQKFGKHVVKEGDIDVQLTEDLSESFRALKPEGNLFKDRFLSLQQRALVEPRERVLPKKRVTKYKEYEKHPWKRFT